MTSVMYRTIVQNLQLYGSFYFHPGVQRALILRADLLLCLQIMDEFLHVPLAMR